MGKRLLPRESNGQVTQELEPQLSFRRSRVAAKGLGVGLEAPTVRDEWRMAHCAVNAIEAKTRTAQTPRSLRSRPPYQGVDNLESAFGEKPCSTQPVE